MCPISVSLTVQSALLLFVAHTHCAFCSHSVFKFCTQVLITHFANCYPTVRIRPCAHNKLVYTPRPSYIMSNALLLWQQYDKRSGMPQCHLFRYRRSISDSLSTQASFCRKTKQGDDNIKENILLGKCIVKLCQNDAVPSSTKHLEIQF